MPALLPPLFQQGRSDEFARSGKILSLAASPRDDAVALFASSNGNVQLPQENESSSSQRNIYFARPHDAPTSERRIFVTDTSIIFAAMQKLRSDARARNVDMSEDDTCVRAMNKLTLDYINFCKECCVYCSRDMPRSEPLQFSAEHYRRLYTCFSLFSMLYVPEPGYDSVPVGDELMEWLNVHYVEPTTEEGDHLSSLERPWEDETFWPYLTRAVVRGLSRASSFFLDTLSGHPSPFLQELSKHLMPLVTNHPRLHQFTAERDFAIAARRWHDKVKGLRLELDRVPEDVREDSFENWWGRIDDIVGILEGREEVVKRVCIDLGGDWKEVCAVWCVFVNTRIRRAELPDLVSDLLDEMPPDPTNLEDVVHSAMFLGKPTNVLAEAQRLDIWLAAHLADMMEALDLIDKEPDDSELTLREHYILSYCEYMRSDPGLWRITVDYLCTCGEIGQQMADEVLMRVPLRLQPPKDAADADEESARIRSGTLAGVLKEVNASCYEHKREAVRRMVCRIAAQTFMKENEYGLAVSYCVSAEDWTGLGHVVDRMLDVYITHGPQQYARSVAKIAPSLQTLRAESKANGIFVYRLMFAVRFAEFHHRRLSGDLQEAAFDLVSMLREEIAPKSWWAVLLSDAVELLQNSENMFFTSVDATLLLHRLEEIHIRSSQGSADEYLAILARTTKTGGEAHALQRLQVVRLALARYYAKCAVIGVGGRTVIGAVH
ncbi:Nup85 nucleoporin-domain-containing protein [Rhodofomes roseus]|uniref:Nuclear pore complex protein Nup85 n=1 Tax=Rhodofomes roseus TaxID=34475 RepID=A0ABQ8K044_9APHY|nr:Nup85 nucleoporin-domain-containing protein [Rhodofomes roseus]KAH9829993.1 Nup85 nucleoporin-domain-containing protein [Rhodofomes roseus]